MKIVDPGHKYELSTLDGDGTPVVLTFVKREGEKFPGNIGAYSGTTLQEVIRACIDRTKYVDNQNRDDSNSTAIAHLECAIGSFEYRAAKRHGRETPSKQEACYGGQCVKCLHVGCSGECHPTCPSCGCKVNGDGICQNYGCE